MGTRARRVVPGRDERIAPPPGPLPAPAEPSAERGKTGLSSPRHDRARARARGTSRRVVHFGIPEANGLHAEDTVDLDCDLRPHADVETCARACHLALPAKVAAPHALRGDGARGRGASRETSRHPEIRLSRPNFAKRGHARPFLPLSADGFAGAGRGPGGGATRPSRPRTTHTSKRRCRPSLDADRDQSSPRAMRARTSGSRRCSSTWMRDCSARSSSVSRTGTAACARMVPVSTPLSTRCTVQPVIFTP